jgi:hypothetical protein
MRSRFEDCEFYRHQREREAEDERRREYEADVAYEVWRAGGNPDLVDYERTDDCYWSGAEPDACAAKELSRQHRARMAAADEGPPYYTEEE